MGLQWILKMNFDWVIARSVNTAINERMAIAKDTWGC